MWPWRVTARDNVPLHKCNRLSWSINHRCFSVVAAKSHFWVLNWYIGGILTKPSISVRWVKHCGTNKNIIIHIYTSPLGTLPVLWSVWRHAVIQEAFHLNRKHFRRQNQNHSRLYQSYNLFKYMYNSSYALLYSRYFIYLLCGRCLLYLQWNSVTTNKNIDFTTLY